MPSPSSERQRTNPTRWVPPLSGRRRGFSLIELMVTIAVAVILIGLGAPHLVQNLRTQEVRAARDELTAALHLAEIEASRRGGNVVLRRKTACDVTLGGDADWHCGYILFADTNANGSRDAGETLLKDITLGGAMRLQHSAGGTNTLVMNAWGRAEGGEHRFVVSSNSTGGAASSTVCLNLGGQLSILTGTVACP
jgi:type IV fimbrial biogenesis protein FimT